MPRQVPSVVYVRWDPDPKMCGEPLIVMAQPTDMLRPGEDSQIVGEYQFKRYVRVTREVKLSVVEVK